ncbi:hypothetical protein QYF61_020686 [Mycteria americana]|uniref:Protein regulator of cytokinesis 1 n=1 Tax=Mycteria americana TaxID=33587 RepID=A0AAN7N825_MYCAM|nr:hypothetical protein QYF61_020686 [Mycteria americana]
MRKRCGAAGGPGQGQGQGDGDGDGDGVWVWEWEWDGTGRDGTGVPARRLLLLLLMAAVGPGAPSEVLAAEAVSCLNRAMAALRDIWEEIGIPEEQRLERTDVVKKHIKVRGGGPWACCGAPRPGAGTARRELAQKRSQGPRARPRVRGQPGLAGAPGDIAALAPHRPVLPCLPLPLALSSLGSSGRSPAAVPLACPGSLRSLLDMMVAEEENLKERLLKSIAVCRKELDTLCKELQLDPFEAEEESTILQMEKNLRTRVEVLLKQKRDRKQELKILQEQDRDLCDILCTAPFCIDSNAVPSLEDLDRYRRHLASLTTEKEQRREEFVSSKRQIILLMEELDHTPDTSFERDVVCEDEEAFCLSMDNIAALQNLLQQLEARRSLNEAVCTELRSRITALWERLQVPVEERESSAVHAIGSRAKTRKALQLEVDRLEELKLQNMKSVIQAIRAELADYWDKCFYSQEQREGFSPYYDEDYTETLLELHDAEVGKMKSYYETHKDLFEAVQKWEENWKLFLELEVLSGQERALPGSVLGHRAAHASAPMCKVLLGKTREALGGHSGSVRARGAVSRALRKATDPSRFTNRGGNLLKEEKQRAKLQKTLSKLQEELESRVQAWEQEHEGAFLVKGQQFMEYVTEQWQLYRLEKEKEKQERVSAKLSVLPPGPEEPLLHRTGRGSCPSRPASHCPGFSVFSLSAWKRLCVQSPFFDGGTGVHCYRCLCVLSPFPGPRTAAWLWKPVNLC